MASNIKDRRNRNNVNRLLKIISEKLKGINKFDKGLFMYVGIGNDAEYVEMFESPYKNTEFFYRCDSKFYTDSLREMIENNTDIHYLILIDGEETHIYKYDKIFILIERINGNLIKRQKKGGQSSVRFARLAEESRHIYITHIVDKINELCRNGKSIWVFGARELKNDLMDSKSLLVKINSFDIFNVIETNFISIHKKELETILLNYDDKQEKEIGNICELITKDPDMLVFGDAIHEDECSAIIKLDDNTHEGSKYIIVGIQSKYYSIMKQYKKIGLRYFKFIEN